MSNYNASLVCTGNLMQKVEGENICIESDVTLMYDVNYGAYFRPERALHLFLTRDLEYDKLSQKELDDIERQIQENLIYDTEDSSKVFIDSSSIKIRHNSKESRR